MKTTTLENKLMEQVAENAVAIADSFYTDNRSHEFYEAHKDELSGFPGIWKWIASAALLFSEAERDHDVVNNDNWIESIHAYVEYIYNSPDLPADRQLLDEANRLMKERL